MEEEHEARRSYLGDGLRVCDQGDHEADHEVKDEGGCQTKVLFWSLGDQLERIEDVRKANDLAYT